MIIYKITGENVALAELHFSTKKVNKHAFVKMRNYSFGNAEFCVWCSTLSSPSPLSLICNGPRDQKKRQALRTRMDVQKLHPYNEIINAQVSVICIRADRVYILLVSPCLRMVLFGKPLSTRASSLLPAKFSNLGGFGLHSNYFICGKKEVEFF